MQTLLYKSSLIIHIICGFTALVTGIVPMIAKKGGKAHNFWGNVYYWAMFGVFATTVIFFLIFPTQFKFQFFLGIGILSFYQTYTGKRLLSMKKAIAPNRLDWVATLLISLAGVGLLIFSIQYFMKNDTSSAILFGVFGLGSLSTGIRDIQLWLGKIEHQKMNWLFNHIGRMLGSYAATTTAFCVNIVPRYLDMLPSWVFIAMWILPGALIGYFSARTIRKYKAKYNVALKPTLFEKMKKLFLKAYAA
jgi:uncharacterized membrane protein HdeD (DUF308 family)